MIFIGAGMTDIVISFCTRKRTWARLSQGADRFEVCRGDKGTLTVVDQAEILPWGLKYEWKSCARLPGLSPGTLRKVLFTQGYRDAPFFDVFLRADLTAKELCAMLKGTRKQVMGHELGGV